MFYAALHVGYLAVIAEFLLDDLLVAEDPPALDFLATSVANPGKLGTIEGLGNGVMPMDQSVEKAQRFVLVSSSSLRTARV